MTQNPTRRGFIGAAGVGEPALAMASAAEAAPVSSELETLIAKHEAAERAFNAAPGFDDDSPEERRYLATLRELDAYVPRTTHEFVRAFSARFSNYLPPNDDTMEELVGIARRLATEGR